MRLKLKGNRPMCVREIGALRKAVANLKTSDNEEESAVGRVLTTALTNRDDPRNSLDITMQCLYDFERTCKMLKEELREILD